MKILSSVGDPSGSGAVGSVIQYALGLPDTDLDPLCRGTDPDPLIIKQN